MKEEIMAPDPFQVEESLEQGRFLVAVEDIEEGQTILTDTACVVGPFTVSVPICLECNVSLVGSSDIANPFCPKGCGFQLCANCKSMSQNNGEENNKERCWHQLECRTIQKSHEKKSKEEEEANVITSHDPSLCRISYKKPSPVYSWVTTLRLLLLLKSRTPDDLRLVNLQDNSNLRQKCDPLSWKLHEKYVIEPLYEMTRLEREEIRHALGILLTNTLSISIEEGQEIMGLFPKYAMLNHSCQHNTVTLTNIASVVEGGNTQRQFKVEVKAKRKIMKGEEITTRYLPVNQGVVSRNQTLLKKWNFTCHCRLCSDPTEGGSYFSAIKCDECEGMMLPQMSADTWVCDKCQARQQPAVDMDKFEGDFLRDLHAMADKAVQTASFHICQTAREVLMQKLHANHYIIIGLENRMVRMPNAPKDEIPALVNHIIQVRQQLDPFFHQTKAFHLLQNLLKGSLQGS